MKKKTRNIIVILLILVILSGSLIFLLNMDKRELLTVKSEEQLLRLLLDRADCMISMLILKSALNESRRY